MTSKRDYYEVLGVERDADSKTIKQAYRKLALQYHPDRNQGDPSAEENFKEAAEAYEVPSDDNKRHLYDRGGFEGLRSSGFSGFGGADLGDIFSQFSDVFAEFFGGGLGGFGFGGGRGMRPFVGDDLRYDLMIALEDAKTGCEKQIEINRSGNCDTCSGTGAQDAELVRCPTCGGRGQVVSGRGGFMIATTCRACGGRGEVAKAHCESCQGSGRIEAKKTLDVRVPPGVDNGVRLRLQGEGDAGRNGGPPGDLYVFLGVEEHDLFIRDAGDLHCELSVPYPTAVTGGRFEVPELASEEHTEIKIPQGMQPGDTVRVKGLGMPRLGDRGTGDMIVHLNVMVPKRLSDEQTEALKALEASLDETPELGALGASRRETRGKKKKSSGFFDRIRDALELED
jgi:molecular chaperone DnaJ